SGLFDAVELQAQVELAGTVLPFFAEVRLPPSTFDLLSPAAPDVPPSSADTMPIQFGGTPNAGNSLLTVPQDPTVPGLLQDGPAAARPGPARGCRRPPAHARGGPCGGHGEWPRRLGRGARRPGPDWDRTDQRRLRGRTALRDRAVARLLDRLRLEPHPLAAR